ncbi:MAG: segregation/condensation protein A [Alphaproteobacteria bacterium]|nr:segregation/condensation protein A [Alphaproteobacteria bacterium]
MEQAVKRDETGYEAIEADGCDLVVNLDGFEGPIDLLLNLARDQKVDLAKISILALAEQYLLYINEARKLRLEIAADYLVVAAWLAFLKSRLLLPEAKADEPPATDMAEALRFQLLRLEAMQKAAQDLQGLPQLGRDVFMRGVPDEIEIIEKPVYYLRVTDLLHALTQPLRRKKSPSYQLPLDKLLSLEDALQRLRNMVGYAPQWMQLADFIPDMLQDPLAARSAIASTFAASLEMVKLGEIQIRQDGTFAPIYVRRAENSATSTVAE